MDSTKHKFRGSKVGLVDSKPLFADSESSKHRSLKNRIRDTKRMLKQRTLPKNLVKDKERLLKKLLEQEKEQKQNEKEAKYARKYHHVKFFERRKAERKLAKAQKILESARINLAEDSDNSKLSEDVRKAENAVKEATDDTIYIKWFPKHLKYLSLYAKSESEDPRLEKRRNALRRWALQNYEARDYLPNPPEVDADMDFGEESDSENEDEMKVITDRAEKAASDDDIDFSALDAVSDMKKESLSQSNSLESKEKLKKSKKPKQSKEFEEEEIPLPEVKPLKRSRASSESSDDVKLPARPQGKSKKLVLGSGHDTLVLPSSKLSTFKGAAADDDEAQAALELAGGEEDPFFAGADESDDGDLVFREEFEEAKFQDDREGGDTSWRSGSQFRGARTSAARYEREHMNAKRYRDSAADRSAQDLNSMNEGNMDDTFKKMADEKLKDLSGRKRRRAERGLMFEHKKLGGSAGVLGGMRTEAVFGTEQDTGARLRHLEKIAVKNRALFGLNKRGNTDGNVKGGESSGRSGFDKKHKPSFNKTKGTFRIPPVASGGSTRTDTNKQFDDMPIPSGKSKHFKFVE